MTALDKNHPKYYKITIFKDLVCGLKWCLLNPPSSLSSSRHIRCSARKSNMPSTLKTTRYYYTPSSRGNTSTGRPVVFIAAHKVKNPNWPEANQLARFTSMTEELNLGLPRTNPASGWGLWVTIPVLEFTFVCLFFLPSPSMITYLH